jgi:deoxyribose-phosphate aldolase
MSHHQVLWPILRQRVAEALARARAEAPAPAPVRLTVAQLAALIDHTLLKADALPSQVEALCAEAAQYHFASVCVNSCHVAVCARLLQGTGVLVGSTVGFPLGAMLAKVKALEARCAIEEGAQEVDMVLNIGALKAGEYTLVRDDIAGVVEAGRAHGVPCKVILETAYLTDEEKVAACLLAVEAGAAFVKTSTGFGPAGATTADVALMRAVVGPQVGVKAAGGIRSYETALAMIAAGANRLGTSAGIKIMQEAAAAQGSA